MFSQSGSQRSRDSNNNKRKKAAATHWIFLLSLNMNPPSDWPLTLHPVLSVKRSHMPLPGLILSGERNAASKMAYYQQTISSFRNSIVKDQEISCTKRRRRAGGSCHEQCQHSRRTTHRLLSPCANLSPLCQLVSSYSKYQLAKLACLLLVAKMATMEKLMKAFESLKSFQQQQGPPTAEELVQRQ